jgi:hypothetical protein
LFLRTFIKNELIEKVVIPSGNKKMIELLSGEYSLWSNAPKPGLINTFFILSRSQEYLILVFKRFNISSEILVFKTFFSIFQIG